jgi:poly(rC)-binding protein 2/3/4
VIGKGGSIIKNLREETGARIKVADAVPGSEERVIIVSANEVIVVFVLVLIKLIVYGVYT